MKQQFGREERWVGGWVAAVQGQQRAVWAVGRGSAAATGEGVGGSRAYVTAALARSIACFAQRYGQPALSCPKLRVWFTLCRRHSPRMNSPGLHAADCVDFFSQRAWRRCDSHSVRHVS